MRIAFDASNFEDCKFETSKIKIEMFKDFYKIESAQLRILMDAGTSNEHEITVPFNNFVITITSMKIIYEAIIPSCYDQDNDLILSLDCTLDFIGRTPPGGTYSDISVYEENQGSYGHKFTICYNNVKGYRISGSLFQFYLRNANVPRDEMDLEGYYIDGEVILDGPGFTNTEVLVSSGGKITVNSPRPPGTTGPFPSSAYISNTTIKGCNTMWKGIDVIGNSALMVENAYVVFPTPGYTLIKDAEIGINLMPNTYLQVNATMHNNVIHIKSNDANLLIGGSGLTSDDLTWLPYYSGQVITKIGVFSNVAIKVINSSMTIKYTGIRNAHTGIDANNSYIGLSAVEIENIPKIYQGPNNNNNITGIAINNIGNGSKRLRIADNSVLNICDIGLKNKKDRVEMANSHVLACRKGIEISNSNIDHYIRDNEVQVSEIGIDMLNNLSGVSQLINNTILLDPGNSQSANLDYSGIRLLENNISGTQVQYNHITVNGIGKYGILLKNNKGGVIENNDITLLGSNKTGFELTPNSFAPGIFTRLTCNDVIGNGLLTQKGYVTTLTNPRLVCNTSHSNGLGFTFSSPCMGSFFHGNKMESGIGLLINSGATIGLNKHQKNCWTSSAASNPSTAINANTTINLILASQFKINPNEASCYLPIWYASGPGDWFFPENVILNNSLCTNSCGSSGGMPIPFSCDFSNFLPVVNQNYLNEPNGSALQWQANAQSYSLLKDYLNCPNWPTSISDFYNQSMNSEIGQLYEIEKGIGNLQIAVSSDISIKNQVNDSLNHIIDQISLLLNGELTEAVKNQINQLYLDISMLQVEIQNLNTTIESTLNIGYQNLISQNQNIQTSTYYGQQLKQVNAIYLQYYHNFDKDVIYSNINLLRSIANLCIKEGGYATMRSRALMDLIISEPEYNDETACSPSQAQITGNQDKITNKEVNIYPNPSKDVIFMSNLNGYKIIGLKIIDLQGKTRLSMINNTEGISQIHHTLTSGCYIINIELEDHSSQIKKLIISEQ